MKEFFPKLTRKDILLLLSLVLGYFLITSLNITKLPIFVDEALYLRWSQIAWHDASWRFISLTDGKQPLYIWFVVPFMKLIQDPLLAGRVASMVSGLGTVLGMWYLGYLVKDKRTGYLAALFTILSPYLFFYNRFGVMEALLTASGVWVLNLSILLARKVRLDLSLLLGMAAGAALLVKSSALFFFLLMPAAFVLVYKREELFSRKTLKYFGYIAIAALLAQVINNVQRLSPWMHMIGEKNSFFVVEYSQIFDEPKRLINNAFDLVRWHSRYTTLAVIAAAFAGAFLMAKKAGRMALLIGIWLLVPLLGTASIARLFAPRYIAFATPYLLMFAAYFTSSLRPKNLKIALLILLTLPTFLIAKLITDPLHFPYVNVDEGYVNGWSAGNGTKQISDYMVGLAEESEEKPIIYTEGTFGILPHGIELYIDGRTNNLDIVGLYPIKEIPPERTLESAMSRPTYFVLNNTEVEGVPDGLELLFQYDKLRDTSMRLYKVLPPETTQ